MDRFKILRDVDPFAKKALDSCKFNIMGVSYRGWRIENDPTLECPYGTSIILEVPENVLKFFMALKNITIEIQSKDKLETFKGEQVKKSTYCTKRKGKSSKIHFLGNIIKIQTSNYVIGKA